MLPVLEGLGGEVPVSIDTAKADVARQALAARRRARQRRDRAARRSRARRVVADAGAYLCLMHMLGEPRTMQADPRYDDVVSDVAAFLEERLGASPSLRASRRSGSASTPGSASARRSSTTSSSCAGSTCSLALGRPVLVGFSRKSSLGRLLGDPEATTRLACRQASRRPSPPTSAARRSSACTTCARRSRR